jgi:hypothetical protein
LTRSRVTLSGHRGMSAYDHSGQFNELARGNYPDPVKIYQTENPEPILNHFGLIDLPSRLRLRTLRSSRYMVTSVATRIKWSSDRSTAQYLFLGIWWLETLETHAPENNHCHCGCHPRRHRVYLDRSRGSGSARRPRTRQHHFKMAFERSGLARYKLTL